MLPPSTVAGDALTAPVTDEAGCPAALGPASGLAAGACAPPRGCAATVKANAKEKTLQRGADRARPPQPTSKLASPSSFLGRSRPSLARLPGFDAVVPDFLELLVEQLLLARALRLQAPHAVELLLANLPRLLGDADVGAKDDAAQLVAHEAEVALRDVTDEVARLVVERVELLLVLADVRPARLRPSAASSPARCATCASSCWSAATSCASYWRACASTGSRLAREALRAAARGPARTRAAPRARAARGTARAPAASFW